MEETKKFNLLRFNEWMNTLNQQNAKCFFILGSKPDNTLFSMVDLQMTPIQMAEILEGVAKDFRLLSFATPKNSIN